MIFNIYELPFKCSLSKYLLKVSWYNPTIAAASFKEFANKPPPYCSHISYIQETCLGSTFLVSRSITLPSKRRSTVDPAFNSFSISYWVKATTILYKLTI